MFYAISLLKRQWIIFSFTVSLQIRARTSLGLQSAPLRDHSRFWRISEPSLLSLFHRNHHSSLLEYMDSKKQSHLSRRRGIKGAMQEHFQECIQPSYTMCEEEIPPRHCLMARVLAVIDLIFFFVSLFSSPAPYPFFSCFCNFVFF